MAGSKWLWSGVLVALQVARIAGQTITSQSHPDWFNGYYIYLDGSTTATSAASCEKTASWGTSGGYGNCCKTDSSDRCAMPTACTNNTVHFDDSSYYTCAGVQSCATMTVYQTAPFGTPSQIQAFCWEDWVAHTVYRELPSETGTSDSTSATAGSTASAATATNTGANDDGDKQSSSKGWIAGVVVGPVVGVALGMFGLWYGYRKMRQAKELQAMAAVSYEPYGHHQLQPQGMPMQQPAYVELDSASNGIHQKP